MTGNDPLQAKILVVDDEPANVLLLRRILDGAGFTNVHATTDPREALALYGTIGPDIVLLDLHMPGLDGFNLLQAFEQMGKLDGYVPVLVLTADATDDAKRRALTNGAMDFVTKPFDVTEVLLRVRNLLKTKALHSKLSTRNGSLTSEVERQRLELHDAQVETAHRLTIAAEVRDDETGEHIERVGLLSKALARALGLPDDEAELIGTAAELHDIGKIGVPDHVLLKPGPLTPEEWQSMRTHTVVGSGILSGSASPLLRAGAEIALSHHERWEGGGYPHDLAGEKIPLAGRIVAVADAFDAMTNDRRYRKARPVDQALEEIERERARQFDPDVAAVLATVVESEFQGSRAASESA